MSDIKFNCIGMTVGHMHDGGTASVYVWYDHEAQLMHAECGSCKADLICLSAKDNKLDLDDPAARTVRGEPAPKKVRHKTWG